jgi:hypothetical protein
VSLLDGVQNFIGPYYLNLHGKRVPNVFSPVFSCSFHKHLFFENARLQGYLFSRVRLQPRSTSSPITALFSSRCLLFYPEDKGTWLLGKVTAKTLPSHTPEELNTYRRFLNMAKLYNFLLTLILHVQEPGCFWNKVMECAGAEANMLINTMSFMAFADKTHCFSTWFSISLSSSHRHSSSSITTTLTTMFK